MSLEEFAMLDDKPNVIRWAHLNFRDITLYDFGLPINENDNTAAVQSKIKEIEETFDLIMIVEHFDESTVLLKNLLCWDYSDLTSLKLNVHDEKSKSTLSDQARKKLKDWLSSDYTMYDHFKEIFKKKIEAFGAKKMSEELSKIRAQNEKAEKKCPVTHVPKEKLPRSERPWGKGVLGNQMLSKGHWNQV